MDDDAPEGPVIKLAYAILLAALRKRAERIRIDGDTSRCVVTFRIDGEDHVELLPPAGLRAYLVRRIAVMASLPIYPRGGSADGEILLKIGDRPEHPRFAVRVSGHGEGLTATLDVLESMDL